VSKQVNEMLRALKIYDECMQDLSRYVGHTRGRTAPGAFDHAIAACLRGMKAQKILDKYSPRKEPTK